jgi:hypothetical protein
MENSNENASTSQWMLDRLAERTPEVVQRNEGKSELIAGFGATVAATAVEYRTQYASVTLLEKDVRRRTADAKPHVEALSAAASGWVLPLSEHLGNFDVLPLTRTDVPTDVTTQAERLIEHMRFATTGPETVLPYADQMVAHLQPLIESATQAHRAQQDALVELQERRRQLRLIGARFEDELIAFRRVLKKVLGPTHRDYKYLSPRRTRRDEAAATELDQTPEQTPETPEPAPEAIDGTDGLTGTDTA